MRLLSSALFFSLGLAIGTVISAPGRHQVDDVARMTASKTAPSPFPADQPPPLPPSGAVDARRRLPSAPCDGAAASCPGGSQQTARG
jgi:hypothetical protein